MLRNLGKTYHFDNPLNPTRCGIARALLSQGFLSVSCSAKAGFSDKNIASNLPFASILEQKHLMTEFINRHCHKIIPLSYRINDYNFRYVINRISKQEYVKNFFFRHGSRWILKPALLNNGEHIHLMNSLQEVKEHYHQNNRMGGEHVLQKYHNPHIIKFQIQYYKLNYFSL